MGNLVALIEVNALMPVTASIKTLADRNWSCEEVASRNIEDETALWHGSRSAEKSSAAYGYRDICGKYNEKTDHCFLNPLFAANKLRLSDGAVDGIANKISGNRKNQNNRPGNGREKSGNVDTARSAMARGKRRQKMQLAPERLMLDSGTTSNMTPNEDRVHSVTERDVEIYLADDTTVSAKEQGARSVSWLRDSGYRKLNPSETLIAPHLSEVSYRCQR